VSDAELVPLLGPAEQTRLPEIIAENVSITTSQITSGAANPAPNLLGVIGGMCSGADSMDDLDELRAGGMPILFYGVCAPSTFGMPLREFIFRAHPPAGVGAPRALVRPDRAHPGADGAGGSGIHRHRLVAVPGVRASQAGWLLLQNKMLKKSLP
jgi:hypothetical protein